MGDPFKHLAAGDDVEIIDTSHNAAIDAGRELIGRRTGNAAGPLPRARDTNVVRIRNDSGLAVERFGILGIDDSVFDPAVEPESFFSEKVLSGVTPSLMNHSAKFVVALEPIANGNVGPALAAGVTQVQILVGSEALTFAQVRIGSVTTLEASSSGGAKILWKESGTGVKWAVIRIDATIAGARLPVEIRMDTIINSTPDTSLVPGQFTGTNGAAIVWDETEQVGDAAEAGFEILASSQTDLVDPAVQINVTGRWSFHWTLKFKQVPWASDVPDILKATRDTENASAGASHTHPFEAWNYVTRGSMAVATLWTRPPAGSWGVILGPQQHAIIPQSHGDLFFAIYQVSTHTIADFTAGTDLRMILTIPLGGEGVAIDEGHFVLERVA